MKVNRLQLSVVSFAIFILLSTVNCTLYPTYAQEDNLGQARISPASPLYFLKSVREIFEVNFAGTDRVKTLRQLEFATRRIREVNSLANTSRQDLIEPTLYRYLLNLQELGSQINIADADMVSQVGDGVSLHMNTLQTIYDQVSNPRAQMSIKAVVNRLLEWDQKFIDRLDSTEKAILISKVKASKLSGCNFLSKESSASALNEVERTVLTSRARACFK